MSVKVGNTEAGNTMKAVMRYFWRGLLVFVPAALTVFALAWTFGKLDAAFRALFKLEQPGLGLALGVVVTFGLITAIGFLASNVLGRWLFGLVDRVFTRLPLVKLLYGSVKDFVEAFASEKKSFDRPVVVELVPGGAAAVGFVTQNDLAALGLGGRVAVYFPQSYNFAGSLLIVSADRVRPLAVDSSVAMTFIVSGGVAGPDAVPERPTDLNIEAGNGSSPDDLSA